MRLSFRSARTVISAALVASVVVLGLHRLKLLQPLEQIVFRGLRPIQSVLNDSASGLRQIAQSVGSVSQLRAENDRLHQEIQRLLVTQEAEKLDRAEALKVESAQRLLGARRWNGVIARVIGRSPDPTYRLYLVNRGSRHGVRVGAAVIISDGVYLGKVLESEPENAKILLLTDPHATTAGLVENRARTQGVLTGEHGLSLKMDLLAKQDPLETGQTVVTSGLDQDIPQGLIIGRISSFTNAPGDLFQTASIVPTAETRDLDVITILRDTNA